MQKDKQDYHIYLVVGRGIKNYNSVGGYYFRFKDNYFPFVKQYDSLGKLKNKYKINIK